MWTGQLTLITSKDNQIHNRDKRDSEGKTGKTVWDWKWKNSDEVYINWDQVPYRVSAEHEAVSDAWILSGQGLGAVPFVVQVANAQYIARNSRWINFLWYNQQKFIYHTILAL